MLSKLRKASLHILAVPMLFILLGNICNQVAINSNHGSMPALHNSESVKAFYAVGYPVTTSEGMILTDHRHSLLTEKSRFYLLCDIIEYDSVVYSIGDMFLYLGEWLMHYSLAVWCYVVAARLLRKEEV
jgi:Family of unknown function (DUF5317)